MINHVSLSMTNHVVDSMEIIITHVHTGKVWV